MNNYPSKYERIFCHLDEDGDGKISSLELRRYLGPKTSCEPLAQLMVESSLEEDHPLLLGLDDFVGLMEMESEEEERIPDLKLAFGMFGEKQRNGRNDDPCITPKSLKKMLSGLGESRTVDECVIMIDRFDLDGDGVLSFDEFKTMMLI